MELPYKTHYLELTYFQRGAMSSKHQGELDGYTSSKELEALLVEEAKKGYEMITVTPIITNNKLTSVHELRITHGLMVVFKKV